MNKIKSTKAITLVALVVTLVVLLILAGISITVLFGDSGIMKTAQEAGNKWNEAAQKEQTELQNLVNEWNELQNGSGIMPETAKWIQDKTRVTSGKVTLEVGQEVKGYTANGVGDGDWSILGAKDGKLLITTNSNQGIVTLEGQDGYVNGVTKLNTEGAKFKDTNNMAESARSIDVEDINRVTGYDPDVIEHGEYVYQWNNKVTYTLSSDGKIHYQGTQYPTTDTVTTRTNFIYWNGTNWISLENKEGKNSITLTHSFYPYYPQTLSPDDSKANETVINGSTSAYTLLFANTDENYYFLSSQYICAYDGACGFGMRIVSNGNVNGNDLYLSGDSTFSRSFGLRPVVTLKSNVKVTENGFLSM